LRRDEVMAASVHGGQYDSVSPEHVPANGWQRAVNWFSFNRRMNVRPGSVQFSVGDPPSGFRPSAVLPTRGLQGASGGLEDWALLVGGEDQGFALVRSTGEWDGLIPQDIGGALPSSDLPWIFIQDRNVVYALREGSGRMKVITADGWTEAGRPAPSLVLTLDSASASGGFLVDGTYQVSYAYYDSQTGHVGNASPPLSVTLSGGGSSQKFTVTDFVAPSSDVRATHYQVFMSRVGGVVQFAQALIAVGTTTHEILADATGAQLETNNERPPASATWMAHWNERMWWVTDDHTVSYSPIDREESYSAAQALTFRQNDGDRINIVFPWGKKQVVAKNRSMMILTGYDRSTWESDEWTHRVGCVAPFTMRNCEGLLVFLSEDGFMTATPDSLPVLVSNDTVRRVLSRVDLERRSLSYADTVNRLGIYFCALPTSDGGWTGVSFNWKDGAWTELSFPTKPRAIRQGFDLDGATIVLAAMDGNNQVYRLFEGHTDSGARIRATLVSRAQRPEAAGPGDLLGINAVGMLCAETRYPVTFTVYGDGKLDDPIVSVSARLQGEPGWKWVRCSTTGDQRSLVQVGIEYDGKDEFWIEQMATDVLSIRGRRDYL